MPVPQAAAFRRDVRGSYVSTIDALDAGLTGAGMLDDALGEYQQRRDAGPMPIYELTTQLATLEPPPPAMQELLGAVAGSQAAMDAFVSVTAGTLSPTEFFDPAYLAKVLGRP